MKKIICFLFLFSITTFIAQTTRYKIVKDDPTIIPESYINIELLGSDLDVDFTDASVYAGINGFYSLSDKLKLEGALRLNYYSISGGGFGFQTEAGAFYVLKTATEVKDVPVTLSTNLFAGKTEEGYSYDETKYFNVKGTYKNQYGARGGIYLKNSSLETGSAGFETNEGYTLTGIYGGFQKITQTFVEAMLANEQSRYGQGRTRMYADAIFFVAKSINDANFNTENEPTFGYRAGFQWQQKPMANNWAKPVYTAEIGSRPFTGFYMLVSIGITLKNF